MTVLKWKNLAMAATLMEIVAGCQTVRVKPPDEGQDGRALPAASVQNGLSLADLVGGDLGLGGGFLIGAAPEKIERGQHEQCVRIARQAEASPATPEVARNATTADVNGDGFVTMDEVLAMSRAGLNDQEMIGRLTATGDVYQLTPEQERYLTDRGLSTAVTDAIHGLSKGTVAFAQAAASHVPPTTGPTTHPSL